MRQFKHFLGLGFWDFEQLKYNGDNHEDNQEIFKLVGEWIEEVGKS